MAAEAVLEYVLGFAFGWTIFQALFMGEMFGSYARALKGTFTSEPPLDELPHGRHDPREQALPSAETRPLTIPPSRCSGSACRLRSWAAPPSAFPMNSCFQSPIISSTAWRCGRKPKHRRCPHEEKDGHGGVEPDRDPFGEAAPYRSFRRLRRACGRFNRRVQPVRGRPLARDRPSIIANRPGGGSSRSSRGSLGAILADPLIVAAGLTLERAAA